MMTTIRNTRSVTKVIRRVTARGLRCVVVLSLWHAPIPWIHIHELAGPQVDRSDSLSEHVAQFHARDLQWGNTAIDWHSHLVLPWCLNHHHNCPDDDERDSGSDEIFAGCQVAAGGTAGTQWIGQPTGRAFLAGQIAAGAGTFAQHAAGAVLFDQARCRHFFETYGSSAAVRDLLSVRLC